jgi:hypothetical protein
MFVGEISGTKENVAALTTETGALLSRFKENSEPL